MNYETWKKHRDALINDNWTAFGKWPAEVQDAMREVEPENRMFMEASGAWISKPRGFMPGMVYRVNPSWPGPAKPEPVAEYVDRPVDKAVNDTIYAYAIAADEDSRVRSIDAAAADPRFAGYVMPDGKLRRRLIFDAQNDGTYRLRVPKAVRLRKEVA